MRTVSTDTKNTKNSIRYLMVLCQYIQLKKKKKRKSKSTNFHVNIDHKLSIRDILQRFFPRNLETDFTSHVEIEYWRWNKNATDEKKSPLQSTNVTTFIISLNVFLSITVFIFIALYKVTSISPHTKLLFRCLVSTDLLTRLITQLLLLCIWYQSWCPSTATFYTTTNKWAVVQVLFSAQQSSLHRLQ